MTTELAKTTDMSQIEKVLMTGNLAELNPQQRVEYYNAVCKSIGLNPLTRPFDYINLNGKLTLYAKKDAADQLRKLNGVSIDDVEISEVGETYMVKVKGHDASGRSDVEIGIVGKKDMQGNAANAQMKAVTKAKRRLTLSICGLGWLDETEVETIRDARPVAVNQDTGEIVESHVSAGEENQDTGEKSDAVELIDPMGSWAVDYAAKVWNITPGEAAKEIAKRQLGKRIDKKEFVEIVDGS
jgi:hypothetical protein